MTASFDTTGLNDYMAFATAPNDGGSRSERRSESAAVETAIQIMQELGTCLHPGHLHSFRHVSSFLLSFKSRCVACDERLSFLGGDPIVKCVACGVLAHRSCATTDPDRWEQSKKCPVNAECLRSRRNSATTASLEGEDLGFENSKTDKGIVVFEENGTYSGSDEKATEGLQVLSLPTDNEKKSEVDSISAAELMQPWTEAGPPVHWAMGQRTKQASTHDEGTLAAAAADVEATTESSTPETEPLLHTDQSFPSVARVLQENILSRFNEGNQQQNNQSSTPTKRRVTSPYPGNLTKKDGKSQQKTKVVSADEDGGSFAQFADRTFEAVKGKVNVAAVAGGIAGGVVGLALAGPAGAYAGYVAAGSSLMMWEGAATLGVVVAGIATGGITGQQIQDRMEERRILSMGEEGSSRKVLLVRPSVKIDPVWDQICREAKKTAPLRRRKARHDSDIVMTGEDEIETSDKVLLLVSRILNDKTSLSGHVHMCLVTSFMERCDMRRSLCETNASISATSPRARRDDAHAVIKHVTATLMEERPEFGASPGLTEVTATAVEGLVFGQLYNSVFEEIVEETFERDVDLWRKITLFEEGRRALEESMGGLISQQALNALKMLPQARSAADKLHFCVRFLDLVSESFFNSTASNICADSLLKIVCQSLILIENQGSCNAQVAFLEEFARDEQLLRGRDGYALVTLQASLHFLNISTDFQNEIFQVEETAHNDDGPESSFLVLGSEVSFESCSS